MLFSGRFHKAFWQRLGIVSKKGLCGERREVIWIHAVSVGEVMAIGPFCRSILERYPDKQVVISTVTQTGNNMAKRLFGDSVSVLYIPLDIPYILNRVFNRIRPRLFVIVETEIWPNLISTLYKRGIPIVIINGRISSRSYKRYMIIKYFMKNILNNITLFCMQSNEYKERIINIGAPPDKVVVTGNMKFDAIGDMPKESFDEIEVIKNSMARKSKLFITGSTHKPEEEIILRVYKRLIISYPDLYLLIAPRHIERVSEIESLVKKFGFIPVKISEIINRKNRFDLKSGIDILILDTIGHLRILYSLATIVFIGGSLIPKGGQNILEPAWFSRPIIFGPHMFNFNDIAKAFLDRKAACMVRDEKQLLSIASELLKDSRKQEALGNHARLLVEENIGASQRNFEKISVLIDN